MYTCCTFIHVYIYKWEVFTEWIQWVQQLNSLASPQLQFHLLAQGSLCDPAGCQLSLQVSATSSLHLIQPRCKCGWRTPCAILNFLLFDLEWRMVLLSEETLFRWRRVSVMLSLWFIDNWTVTLRGNVDSEYFNTTEFMENPRWETKKRRFWLMSDCVCTFTLKAQCSQLTRLH